MLLFELSKYCSAVLKPYIPLVSESLASECPNLAKEITGSPQAAIVNITLTSNSNGNRKEYESLGRREITVQFTHSS